jgi:hypothetical protein
MLGIAAVSVRAVVIDDRTSPQPPSRTRAADAPRARAAVIRVLANAPMRAVAVAPSEAEQAAAAQSPIMASPNSALNAVVNAAPSVIVRPTVLMLAGAARAAGTPASALETAPVPPGFQRGPLDWRTLVSHPGVTFGVEEITDASAGSSALSGARSLRTPSNIKLTLDVASNPKRACQLQRSVRHHGSGISESRQIFRAR